jgi:hypothetical protein
VAIAIASVVAVATMLILDRGPVPRPAWGVVVFVVALLWLFVAYFIVWRDLMLRVYRRLAPSNLTDQQRHVRRLLALLAVVVFRSAGCLP